MIRTMDFSNVVPLETVAGTAQHSDVQRCSNDKISEYSSILADYRAGEKERGRGGKSGKQKLLLKNNRLKLIVRHYLIPAKLRRLKGDGVMETFRRSPSIL